MGTEFGVGRGKVFPAAKARSLLNPTRRLVQSPTRLARRLEAAPDDRILEVGCGPGYFSPALAAAVPQGHLVLVDLQREMLDLATARVAEAADRVGSMQADASRLPLRDGSFDAVVVILMLGEVPDREACLAQVRRVLRVGGTALFAETRRDSDYIGPDELRTLVEPHDFDLVDRRGPSWEYTARFRAV